MKKIFSHISRMLIILLILAMLPGHVLPTEAEENPAKQETVIRVGFTPNGQMIQKTADGFIGYGVDYLNMIAQYTNWKYEYVPVSEKNRIPNLESDNIQLLCDISEDETDLSQLILSDNSSCISYAMLCARENDTSVFYDDYEFINGKRIAINNSRKMGHIMDEFAKDHKIQYTPVYCSSFAEMQSAVENGRADLLVASNQRKPDGYKYIAKLGIRDQFFAVSEKHPEIMEKINFADRQIKIKQPFISASLYETYYGRPSEVLTGTTREEYEFLQSHKTIRVVCDASSYPVEYQDEETGEYRGIYADALELISKESGLNFTFFPIDNYKDAWEMLRSGKADMAAGAYLNDTMQEKYHFTTSIPYIQSDYMMVSTANGKKDGELKLAIPENHVGLQSYITDHYPKWSVIPAKNNQECLKMVEKGTADGTLINAVFLQTVYNLSNYSNLVVLPMHTITVPIGCAFTGPDAKLLCQIVDKTIRRIPAASFAKCAVENSINVSYEPTTADIMRKVYPIFLGVLAVFFVLYLMTLFMRERHYRRLAMTDSLTGLWNGMCFRKKAEEMLSHNRQGTYHLISMDIDHFKYINSDFGETSANEILRSIAGKLHLTFGKNALCAREMADMYLILAKGNMNIDQVIHELSADISFDNNGLRHHYPPEVKLGICRILAEDEPLPVNEYIDRAIAARRSIKGNPSKCFAYYDKKMAAEISHERQIERKMEKALDNHEFVVYYQPKYNLSSETIAGAEALVRWLDPEQGLIPPNDFILLFERNGFIVQLDFYVYEEVLKTIAGWIQEGRHPITVSVNVSRVHIGTSNFLSKLVELTDRYQVPRRLLELELTETVLGGKRQEVLSFVRDCKAKGFQISIDDFGSGYSSLNLLKELPVDVLKIDREFLNVTESSEKDRIILEQIVEMASKIHIRTLCEGVETDAQTEFLKKIGCNLAQGYLFSRPVPLEQFEELLKT